MYDRLVIFGSLRRWLSAVCLSALIVAGCKSEMGQQPRSLNGQGSSPPAAPLGEATLVTRVGSAELNLAQVQAEVEAFVDRYVLQVSETSNQIIRAHSEFRGRLQALRLAIARGGYSIAAGPNPVASLLDIIVQTTLVRSTVERHMATRLPDDAAQQLLSVLSAGQNEAWALGERMLSPQDLTDLRSLIDTWLAENPDVVYVAGIRFADFARLRPTASTTSKSSIFGLLRIDPFASIDPAAREIYEARLLAERIFYYWQRMPQLLAWQTESLYDNLLGTQETRQLFANIDEFTSATRDLTTSIENLPQEIQQKLEQSSAKVLEVTNEVNAALAQMDATATNLRALGDTATQTAKAWEETVKAVNEVATTLTSDEDGGPPTEPVTVTDVISVLKESQTTALELRELLKDVNAAAAEGSVQETLTTSVAQARRDVQSLIITSTICAIIVIACAFGGALAYRAITRRWASG